MNPMTYDAEEDQLRERTQYSQMDRHLIPVEFQQQPVSTGVGDDVEWEKGSIAVLDNHCGR